MLVDLGVGQRGVAKEQKLEHSGAGSLERGVAWN